MLASANIYIDPKFRHNSTYIKIWLHSAFFNFLYFFKKMTKLPDFVVCRYVFQFWRWMYFSVFSHSMYVTHSTKILSLFFWKIGFTNEKPFLKNMSSEEDTLELHVDVSSSMEHKDTKWWKEYLLQATRHNNYVIITDGIIANGIL